MGAITKGYWQATKKFLSVTGSVQKLLPQPGRTHGFCLDQAVEIMNQEGLRQEVALVRQYLGDLHEGVVWADSAWKNSTHFFNPLTGKGIWGWPNAMVEATAHYELAIRKARVCNLNRSMFFLGAAVHLIQDLCVPHHARGVLLEGHQEFEDWASRNCTKFAVEQGGIYHSGANPIRWMLQNARVAYKLFPLVAESPDQDYITAGKILIPMAQRATAGFITRFCQQHILYSKNFISR